MSKIKIGVQVTAKVCHTNVTVSGTFQGYRLEDQEDPTSICGTVLHVNDGMQHLDYVYVDSIKVFESEDERIRKELIFFLKEEIPQCSIKEHADKLKEFVSYLEKQKDKVVEFDHDREQQPAKEDGPFDEDKFLEGELAAFLQNYDKEYDDDAAISDVAIHFYELGKKMKQKPAEWSEEYRKEDLRTRFAFYTYKDEDGVLYLSNVFVEETSRNKGFGTKILQAAEMVAQTIGALTIRLKVKQNTPANDWYRRHGYGYLVFEDGYDWLEKNLEYLKPKQKWSEEDDALLKEIVSFFRDGTVKLQHDLDLYAGFLENKFKFLRPRPRWKPREEQMEAVEEALEFYSGITATAKGLRSLYNDLKKL